MIDNQSKNEEHKSSHLENKVSRDFVVKNMPPLSSFSAASYDQEKKDSNANLAKDVINQPNKHHRTGLFIIIGGLLIIIALFFLAYKFLILPSLNQTKDNVVVSDNLVNQKPSVDDTYVKIETEEINTEIMVDETIIEPVVESEDELVTEAEIATLNVPLLIDSDQDGLSDMSEYYLGTDPNNVDSDNDTYSDKDEILNSYNPLGLGLLSENTNISLFTNNQQNYALVYPSAWEVDIVNTNSVLFAAPDQDFIQISYEDSGGIYTSIVDWYQEQFAEVDILTDDRLLVTAFGVGALSADEKFVYFLDQNGTGILVISYIPAGELLPYKEIFQMMSNTLMRIE